MTELKKCYENKNGDWVKIVKTKINDDNKYLLEFLSNEFNEKQVVYGEIEFDVHLLKEVKWKLKI